jgi:hypothetical protein
MGRFGYKITSALALLGAMWVLDIRVSGLRLIVGAILMCVSFGLWGAAKPTS